MEVLSDSLTHLPYDDGCMIPDTVLVFTYENAIAMQLKDEVLIEGSY